MTHRGWGIPLLIVLVMALVACNQRPATPGPDLAAPREEATARDDMAPHGQQPTSPDDEAPSDQIEDGPPGLTGGEPPGQARRGNDDQDEDEPRGEAGRCGAGLRPAHPQVARLAAQFDADAEEVAGWFCAGYGLGEIRQAYRISQSVDMPVEEVFALRESGLGWGEIRRLLGASPSSGPPDNALEDD